MFDVQFTVDMMPVGKGRPRLGGGRVFTPKKTHDAEKRIAFAARAAMAGRQATAVPLMMFVECVFPVPPSYTGRMRQEIEAGHRIPPRVDVDNLAKTALDALNAIVYDDDSQVCILIAQKRYGEDAQLWIRVMQHDGAVPSIRSAQ
jgi:Holliday junction resolvase RusA-like endonuclease